MPPIKVLTEIVYFVLVGVDFDMFECSRVENNNVIVEKRRTVANRKIGDISASDSCNIRMWFLMGCIGQGVCKYLRLFA